MKRMIHFVVILFTLSLSIEAMVVDMTLEEKVAQLFLVDFSSFTKIDALTQMTPELKEKLLRYQVGGFIFFAKNISDRDQIAGFIKDLQETAQTPLWISVDEEGGRVSRLQRNKKIGVTVTPSARELGNTKDPINAYNTYSIIGKEMKALGFNMDLAPVADVNTNPVNQVIGDRAFSSDPIIVGNFVIQSVQALENQEVASVIKHFPGHGDTSKDSHNGAVYVEHTMDRLNTMELVPFKMAIDQGLSSIMVGHISLPVITGNDEPATVSKKIITGILREQLGFEGIIMTDALNMQAITEHYQSDDACEKAILAGVDILLMPKDFDLAYKGILNAAREGRIAVERIDQSVERILRLKKAMNLFDKEKVDSLYQ